MLMRSTLVTRASAFLFGLAGVALLFAPVELLARIAPAVPPSAAWIGQLLGAAWLGLAAMNWTTRFAMVGGIYGRAVVFANATAYFVSAMVMLSAARRVSSTSALLVLAIVTLAMAALYGYLLFRGPFAADRLTSDRAVPARDASGA